MHNKVDIELKLECSIKLFRHYERQAKACFDIYKDLSQAYYMYDYYMEMAEMYRMVILALI